MRKLITLLTMCVLCSSVSFSQTIVNFNPGVQSVSVPGLGQSFTATVDGQITQIDVKTATNLFNASIHIYNSSNGSGIIGSSGSPDYTQSGLNMISNNSLDPSDWTTISLNTPFPVNAGSTYSFIIANTNPLDLVHLFVESTNSYNLGDMYVQYAAMQPGYDLNFRIWETPNPPPPGPTPTPLSAWPAAIAILALVAIKLLRK